jgi:hypothetical protein
MLDRIREMLLVAVNAGRCGAPPGPAIEEAILGGDRQLRIDQLNFDSLAWMEFCISIELQSGRELTSVDVERMRYVFQIEDWLRASTENSGADMVATNQTVSRRRPPLGAEIEDKIRSFTSNWKGERSAPGALLFGLNRSGKERPLFWCLQSSHELDQLALHLGPERPLYGMRSGHLIMSYTETNTKALARRYTDEILSVDGTGPYLIGANCQGAIIAVEIARQLQETGRQILLLTTIDSAVWDLFRDKPYPGKVAFFFGISSSFNPLRRFRSPQLGWRKVFPQGVRFELLPADHGEYFTDQIMHTFVPKLRSAFEWAERSAVLEIDDIYPTGRLPKAIYRPKFQTPQTLLMRPGEVSVVSMRVTNDASKAWPATAESGITLGNHWLTSTGELLVWADGRTPLHECVPPGRTIALDLRVRAPTVPGEYLLEIDLVEEGVTWFKERGSPAAVVQVNVSHRNRLAGWALEQQAAESEALRHELQLLGGQVSGLQASLAATTAESEALRSKLQADLRARTAESEALRRELQLLTGSLSWRAGKPLRALGAKFPRAATFLKRLLNTQLRRARNLTSAREQITHSGANGAFEAEGLEINPATETSACPSSESG